MMTCKYCGRGVPGDSIYCCYCGERLARKRKEKKQGITVPRPRQLHSGNWTIQLRKENVSVTEKSKQACIDKAKAIRAGYIQVQKALPKQCLGDLIREYIDDNEPVLSPSTVRAYESMARNRFQRYQRMDLNGIKWQQAINNECAECSPKTVLNGWRLVTAAMRYKGLEVPNVKLPQVVQEERPWLDYQEIQAFIKAIEGKSCETACLLALHSLRISEIRALTPGSIEDEIIHVRGATVPDKNNKMVTKAANKNATSRRDVPVMIPRLLEIWPEHDEELIIPGGAALRGQIAKACEECGYNVITIHGLRHSFASLAYHLGWDMMTTCAVGGWKTSNTVQKVYTHLAITDKNTNVEAMKNFYKTGC